jgi:hypothetical protein
VCGKVRNIRSFVSKAQSGGGKSTRGSKGLPGLHDDPKPLIPWDDTADMPHAASVARKSPRSAASYTKNR